MRAALSKSTEDRWSDVDVGHTSAIWEDHLAASEVFIVPTVISGQGTRRLLTIAEQGATELNVQARELSHGVEAAGREQLRAKLHFAFTMIQQQRQADSTFNEDQAREQAQLMLGVFDLQTTRAKHAHFLAEHVAARFDQVQRVAQTLLAAQEKYGDQITKEQGGLTKLTIGMKCLDTLWADIIHSLRQLKKVREELDASKVSLLPLEASPVRTGTIAGHDGPRQVIIFDPTSMLSRTGSTVQLERVTEINGSERSVASEPSPKTNDETTFVGTFEEKFKISDGDSNSEGDNARPAHGKMETIDEEADESSLADTLHEDESEFEL